MEIAAEIPFASVRAVELWPILHEAPREHSVSSAEAPPGDLPHRLVRQVPGAASTPAR
ncbi:hypothetical protein [Actinoallomurus sp. CA-150999]|uniref:hypothetical protein n=1 Tax=Actinoallomurus sp. CA-150999 TaxID=3239887 RepID=UPI003D92C105